MTNRPSVTQAAYARMRGVTRQRVNRLRFEGRLVLDEHGLVDVERSDALLESLADPTHAANRDGDAPIKGTLAEVRYRKEAAAAARAELQLARESGELCEVAAVESASLELAQAFRQMIDALGRDVVPALVATSDMHEAQKVWAKLSAQHANALSETLERRFREITADA